MKLVIDIAALNKTQAAVVSITDTTPVTELQQLTLGNTEPLDITFTDSSLTPPAAPSWAGQVGYVLKVGLGSTDADALLNYTSTVDFTIQTNGWTGRLNLATQNLIDALKLQCGFSVDRARFGGGYDGITGALQARPRWAYFYLQIEVTDTSNNTTNYAVLRVPVLNRVLPTLVASSATSTDPQAVTAVPTTGVLISPTNFFTANNILQNQLTTLGDTIYGGVGGAATRLPGNTTAALQVLTQTGTGAVSAAPAWLATTGTGSVVRETSPTLVAPALGTPTSGVATNLTGTAAGLTAGNVTTNANLTGDVTSAGNAATLATVNSNVGSFGSATQASAVTVNAKGLVTAASNVTVTPAVGSVTGLGSGVATALAVNIGSAGAPVLFNGAGGIPSSLIGTNITGTASGLTAGNATTAVNQSGGTVAATTLSASGTVEFTSNGAAAVNIGVAGSGGGNMVNVARAGVGGAPATSGTTQTYGLIRLQSDSFATVLDGGSNGGSGFWLQAVSKADLSSNQPLLLNPNGGNISAFPVYGNTSGAAANVAIDSAGLLYRSTSSRKYKRDIINYTRGLSDVLKLRTVFYKGKSKSDGETQFAGLIAEEVAEAGLSEFVVLAKDGTPDALSYANMIALAFNAIQELAAKNDALESRVTTLEKKLSS